METENTKKRRERRTKAAIETDLWRAIEKQIIKNGVNNLTITGISQEAKFEPTVIYNRFSNMNDLLGKYLREHDYWLNNTIKIDKKEDPKENLKKAFTSLIEALYENEVMQKILVWELSKASPIGNRTAMNREIHSDAIFAYFNKMLNVTGSEVRPLMALIMGGIYYLTLYKKISTFSRINFDSDQGKEILIKTVENIIEHSFSNNPKDSDKE